jgi:hypothetical protein
MSLSASHRSCGLVIVLTASLGLAASCGGKVVVDHDMTLGGGGSGSTTVLSGGLTSTSTTMSTSSAGENRCGKPGGPDVGSCCQELCEVAREACPSTQEGCNCRAVIDLPASCIQPWSALWGCGIDNPDLFVCGKLGVEFACGPCDAQIAALNTACNVGIACAP